MVALKVKPNCVCHIINDYKFRFCLTGFVLRSLQDALQTGTYRLAVQQNTEEHVGKVI